MDKRPIGLTVFGFGSYLLASLNLALYVTMILLMGIRWQMEVVSRFVRGNAQALGLLWANYSPLVFAILLIYIGKNILRKRNHIFIRNTAIAYLVLDVIAIFGNITVVMTTIINLVYFACLLVFITRSKVKEQFTHSEPALKD